MAKTEPSKKKDWKQHLRLMIIHDKTLEEVFALRFTKMEGFIYLGILLFFIVALTFSVIFFTKVRELIPGYPDSGMRRNIVMNAILLDSLENEIRMRDQYFQNFRAIVSGEEPDSFLTSQSHDLSVSDIEFSRSPDDSLLREQIEVEEKFSLSIQEPNFHEQEISDLYFIPPVRGIVVNPFNLPENHYGTDVVAGPNDVVKACLNGTVISATWTLETGYVLQIQHETDLVSVYKHNRELLKQEGDVVKAGEAIAIIGNSGELSTGPHLHFELWHKGTPLNPEEYIVF